MSRIAALRRQNSSEIDLMLRAQRRLAAQNPVYSYGFDDVNEGNVEARFASTLRATAIEHLRSSDDVVARAFRNESVAAGYSRSFLSQQEKEGAWGTYIEATALGEKLGVHVVVTPIKSGVEQDTVCLYRAANDNAPTVHLYNSSNCHWHYHRDSRKTRGDGNCLYNAFSQALYYQVKPMIDAQKKPVVSQVETPRKAVTATVVEKTPTTTEAHKASAPAVVKPKMEASVLSKQNLFTSAEGEVIKHQQRIRAAVVSSTQKPDVVKAAYEAKEAYVKELLPKEREQIADDYQLALRLAREEMMSYRTHNIFRAATRSAENSVMLRLR